jgi:hypothetical protein
MFHLPIQVCFSHSALADSIASTDHHVTQGEKRQIACRSRNAGRWQTRKKGFVLGYCAQRTRERSCKRVISVSISTGGQFYNVCPTTNHSIGLARRIFRKDSRRLRYGRLQIHLYVWYAFVTARQRRSR